MRRRAAGLAALLGSFTATTAYAQQTVKSIQAVRADQPLSIDGKLEEPAWANARRAGDFVQQLPDEQAPATEKTQFRVLYDDHNLYIGVNCYDSEPDKIVARLTRRDRDIEADWLAVTIDSLHNHDSAFVFQVSAAGVLVDGQMTGDANFSYEWDGVWTGASSIDARGWTAEFAIPLTQLRFSDAEEQTWGIEVHRGVSRKRERSMWVFIPDKANSWVSRAGHLTGIRGLKPRRTFELRPYGVVRARGRTTEGVSFLGATEAGRQDVSFDPGADLKLGLTSRLTLDATVNPDFGQIEADQVVLNLTRFETFFPEKRPFFLEGRELFETPYTQFYARRIGQPLSLLGPGDSYFDAGRQEHEVLDVPGAVRILGAAKVTGSVSDKLSIAALAAVTGNERLTVSGPEGVIDSPRVESGRSWAVLRARYAVADGAFLGVMATAMARLGDLHYLAGADHDAYTQGIDATWQSQDGQLRIVGQLLLSERVGGSRFEDGNGRPCENPDTDLDCVPISRADGTQIGPGDVGVGGGGKIDHRGDRWDLSLNAGVFSPRLFLNDIGFLQEFNQAVFEAVAVRKEKNAEHNLQRYYLIPYLFGAISLDGRPLNAGVGFNTEWNFRNFYYTSEELQARLPGTWDNVETLDGAYFEKPAQLEGDFRFNSNPSNAFWWMLNANGQVEVGEPGYAFNLTGGLYWQAASNIELGLEPQLGWDTHRIRFYDCRTDTGRSCLVEDGPRHYRFAQLDANFISATLRATYTFSTKLSLSAYGQLFMARGNYHDFYAIDSVGRHPLLRRGDLRPIPDNGDDDGDGIPDQDFETTQVNLNVVTRWEPMPGTTLFLVYTRGMNSDFYHLRNLDRGPAEDVFLVKLVYFLS